MIFRETTLKGAFIIEPERIEDERGFFARTFCRKEFEAHGLNPNLVQCSVSFNKIKGTLRGLHYQVAPYEEAKLVRCTRGAVFDVVVDLRSQSDSFRQWHSVILNAENQLMIYIPPGMAHGLQTLDNDTEVLYQMSCEFVPEASRGIRWDDPLVNVNWPLSPSVISARDRAFPLLV